MKGYRLLYAITKIVSLESSPIIELLRRQPQTEEITDTLILITENNYDECSYCAHHIH